MGAPLITDLSGLIIDASNYRVALNTPPAPGSTGVVFPMKTVNSIEWTVSAENEQFYAVGQKNPYGNDNNAYKYAGKLSCEAGEAFSLYAANGIKSGVFFLPSVLGIVALDGTYTFTFLGVLFTSDANSIKSKDKNSIVNLDWTAIGLT